MSRIVIALGGNALGNTPAEQLRHFDAVAPSLIDLIDQGHEIIVSHGNGPQVGAINLAFEYAHARDPEIPLVDLPECTAMSQGYIGFQLQQGLTRALRLRQMPWHVATVVTQVEVDPADPAFANPTKPIGAFYDEITARALMAADPGLHMKQDAGRGWRRVVASPRPVTIVEAESILNLLDHEFIVIACGGGGVPVVKDADGDYCGVAAVIDKDFASAKLADAVGADALFILTAVDQVAINFGRPDQQDLDEMDLATAQRYVDEGQFAPGSMLPKVQAAMSFVAGGRKVDGTPDPGGVPGSPISARRAVICSLEKAPLAMRGQSGTLIHA